MCRTFRSLVIAFSLLCSCQPTPRQIHERRLIETGEPSLHAVYSDRLENIMSDLDALMFGHLPQEINVDRRRRRHAQEIASLALKLEESAKQIPEVLSEVRLASAERKIFTDFADKLARQSRELYEIARDERIHELSGQTDAIIATCNACHSAFRILPVIDKAK